MNRFAVISLFVLSSWSISGYAQDPSWWLRMGGDNRDLFRDIDVTPGFKGFCVAGQTQIKNKNYDSWAVKLDRTGKKLWSKKLGGEKKDKFYAVVATKDGGCVFAGLTSSKGAGMQDGWVIALDRNGKVRWEKTYGGKRHDVLFDILSGPGGGFYLIGTTGSKGRGTWDGWVLRIDRRGKQLWEKTFGGTDYDGLFSGVATPDGLVVVGGTWSAGTGKEDFWVIRLKKNGKTSWVKTYGGKKNEEAKSVVRTKDGGFAIVGGTFSKGAGKEDVWLLRIDKNGKQLWDKTFGGRKWEGAWKLVTTRDRGFMIAGWTKSQGVGRADMWLIRVDRNGKKFWEKTYGTSGTDIAYSLVQKRDGGFLVAGYTEEKGVLLEAVVLNIDPKGALIAPKATK